MRMELLRHPKERTLRDIRSTGLPWRNFITGPSTEAQGKVHRRHLRDMKLKWKKVPSFLSVKVKFLKKKVKLLAFAELFLNVPPANK
jgi:hypothetical protein